MSMSPSLPLPPNEDRGPKLLASLWVPFPFTVVLLGTRFYSRIARRDLGLDDWFILAAWILYTAGLVMSTVIVNHDGIRHLVYVDPEDMMLTLKLMMASQPLGMFSAVFGKSSVALFIGRISGSTSKWRSHFLTVNIILYFAISFASLGVMFGQCVPTRALWEPQLLATGEATCLDPEINVKVSIVQGSFGAYLDFILAFLPLTFLIELKVSIKKRIALCVLLGLGVVAGVCACIKTMQFSKASDATDPTWSSYPLYMWASLELAFVLIAACVPPSKPIWDFLLKRRPIGGSKNSSYTPGSNSSYRMMSGTGSQAGTKVRVRRASRDEGERLVSLRYNPMAIKKTVKITQVSRSQRSLDPEDVE